MTPYEMDCERERRDEEQSAIAEGGSSTIAAEWYHEGQDDASGGRLARWADEAYLSGYVAALKELPKNSDGTLKHYTPRQHFAFGFMDSPDDCTCDEF
jgi:hypothetical protein